MLNTSGSVIGTQLYSPYGSKRYSTGVLPTSIGFTGQRADSVTGLDYYNARYYDPVVGRFVSADTVQGNGQGMDPYGYVGGDPETRTDPTGTRFVFGAPGETYNPSDCGSCTIGAGGTVVSKYVPPVRNTTSNNSGNPKIVTGGNTHSSNSSNTTSTFTPAQLKKGDTAKQNRLQSANNGENIASMVLALVNGVQNTKEIIESIIDITENGSSLDDILDILSSSLGIIGDIMNGLYQAARVLHWGDGFKTFFSMVGEFMDYASASVKAIQAMLGSPFGTFLKNIVSFGINFLTTFLSGGVVKAALAGVTGFITDQIKQLSWGKLIDYGMEGIESAAQAWYLGQEHQVDVLNGMTDPQYCQAYSQDCQ